MVEDVRQIEEASKKRHELIDQAKDAIEVRVEEAMIGQGIKHILEELQVNGNDKRNWRCACVFIRSILLVEMTAKLWTKGSEAGHSSCFFSLQC